MYASIKKIVPCRYYSKMLFCSELRIWNTLLFIKNSAFCRLFKPQPTPSSVSGAVGKFLSKDLCISSPPEFNNISTTCISYINQKQYISTSHACSRKKGRFKKYDDLNDDEEEDEEDTLFSDKKHSKTFQTNSTRLDLMLKTGLGYSRKFVDEAFYESRVMLNGKKALKKNEVMKIGDEVDIVQGYSPNNPKFLIVSRVELKSVEPVDEDSPEEGIRVKVLRFKNCTVKNYDPPWKSSSNELKDLA